MNRLVAVAVILLGTAVPAQQPTDAAQFELKAGAQTLDVVEGKPFTFTTPKGERVELVLARKAEQTFVDEGLQFRYPQEMRVTREVEDGTVTLTVEATNSVLAVLQLFPEGAPAATVRQELERGILQEFAARGGVAKKQEGTEVSRKFGKRELKGVRYDITMAGESFEIEVYALVHQKRVLGVVLQNFVEDRALAVKWFGTILGSLR
jgi:hypothetical protein